MKDTVLYPMARPVIPAGRQLDTRVIEECVMDTIGEYPHEGEIIIEFGTRFLGPLNLGKCCHRHKKLRASKRIRDFKAVQKLREFLFGQAEKDKEQSDTWVITTQSVHQGATMNSLTSTEDIYSAALPELPESVIDTALLLVFRECMNRLNRSTSGTDCVGCRYYGKYPSGYWCVFSDIKPKYWNLHKIRGIGK
jgi:hypothetical protein